MKFTIVALTAFAASVTAQGVTSIIKPTAAAPPGCEPTFPGTFQLQVAPPTQLSRRGSPVERTAFEVKARVQLELETGNS
jgi:hypothetical protein